MKRLLIAFSLPFTCYSCDCMQQASGVVLDKKTHLPIYNVALGKLEQADTTTLKEYTNENGAFEYQGTSGGVTGCPEFVLYFTKPGYKTEKMAPKNNSQADTIYLERINLNRDSSIHISLAEYNKEVDYSIQLLSTQKISDINDVQHIQIMYCLNTIQMNRLEGGRYQQLKKLVAEKNYIRELMSIYKNWVPNRGLGMYIPPLQMELGGTPSLKTVYTIVN